jgi:hypothetical protein
MAKKEYSQYQKAVISGYYNNLDTIMLGKLSELVTELYLADKEAKKARSPMAEGPQGHGKAESPAGHHRPHNGKTRCGNLSQKPPGLAERKKQREKMKD